MMQERLATSGQDILEWAAKNDAFLLDIGTKAGDLDSRRAAVGKALADVDERWREKASSLVHYSAGLWPSSDAIKERKNALKTLEKDIKQFSVNGEGVLAIGECGLDHHWNPTGEDRRSESDFGKKELKGEAELFEAQLQMAKKMKLPVIVHSRDAFEGTLECIRNIGYDNGVIHCFSYGINEVKAFLERGWMIAFGGGVTYTKRSKMDALHEVICAVPEDAILIETDAPYLAPEPMRGRPNTPLYIEYTYKFVADIRGVSTQKLCETVEGNTKRLFLSGEKAHRTIKSLTEMSDTVTERS